MSGSPTTFSEADVEQYASRYSHAVVQYFRTHSSAVATVDELARAVSDQQADAQRAVGVRLHHVTLPRLADAGVIDYDARSTTARYRGDEPGDRLPEETEG